VALITRRLPIKKKNDLFFLLINNNGATWCVLWVNPVITRGSPAKSFLRAEVKAGGHKG
jgi:hypothetical protein